MRTAGAILLWMIIVVIAVPVAACIAWTVFGIAVGMDSPAP